MMTEIEHLRELLQQREAEILSLKAILEELAYTPNKQVQDTQQVRSEDGKLKSKN